MTDAAKPSSNPPRGHLLLVEDSDTQAMKLTFQLEDADWKVSRVADAEAGLEFLNRELPDLIVIDYLLPGIRGDAFCRQVRMKAATRHIPLLMLTSETSDSAQIQGLDSGADDYLPKSADFEVLLLRMQVLLRKTGLRSQALGPFQQASLLAIDDSPTYLEFLSIELQQEGYLLETARDAQTGLQMAQNRHFDCVLVDLVMPGMDGIEVCRRLSELEPGASPLVLMLTAHDTPTELARALEAGADDFVGKSNDVSVLKGRVRALLRRKFSQDENQRLLQEIIQTKELEAQHALKAQQEAEARATLATELEQALRRLQASKQEIEQLAYISAHDLQEPLRHLTNYSQLLSKRYGEGLDAKGQQYFQFILENTARMKRQLASLLNYLSVSSAEAHFEPVALADLLARLDQSLAAELAAAGAELSHEPDLPGVTASRQHLEMLFRHLILNAIQFRSRERALRIAISVSEREQDWLICVQDNGIGIESQYHRQVFDIFQHLHGQRLHAGSGMGLSICRRIAEIHHGEIWIESEPDQGSKFCVTLSKALHSS